LYIRYGIHTDRGRIRTSNEDSYVANAKSRLFLVADGMGGHAAGEIASAIAASTVEECVALRRGTGRNAREILRLAVQEANSRIYETQLERSDLAGMGSTLTALCFSEDSFCLAHVGDSRAYLMRGGELRQITRDHSLVWHLYENGVIAKKDLVCHPQKNLITRSIGPHPQVEIDVGSGDAREGDCYLLCSDGLTDVVPDEMIGAMLADTGQAPQKISELLVDAANRAGGPDNVTAIVVRIVPGDSEDDETGRMFP
jgi:serine/threonine protein phosphatase PrpC